MFNTLRRTNSSDGSLVIEPDEAPFNKKPKARLVRLACVHCRSKKVKCTGEKKGCQRCQYRNLQCSYIDVPQPRHRPRATRSSIEHVTEQLQQDDTQCHSATDSTLSLSPLFTQHANPRTDVNDAAGDWTDTASDPATSDLDLGEDCMPCIAYPDVLSFTDLFPDAFSGFNTNDSSDLSSLMRFDRRSVGFSASNSSCGSCSCSDLLRVFEMVEVLVRVPFDSSRAAHLGADELLRSQKAALEACTSRLRCKVCKFESHDAMLMISICEKLLASILQIECRDGITDGGISQSHARPNSVSGTTSDACKSLSALLDRIVFDKQGTTMQRGVHEERRPNVWDDQHPTSDHTGWCIDDEDKRHVLNTLLRIRKEKLSDLLAELEGTVAQRHWLVHTGLIQSLLARLAIGETSASRQVSFG